MSILLDICADSGFLRVGATGDFSLVEAKRTFRETLEAVARNKAVKVLFDGRGPAGSPKIMERFFYGEFAARSVAQFTARGVSASTQFAYVLKVPVLDPMRFGETLAVNRGMVVKTFDNPNDALEWLGIPPAPRPRDGRGAEGHELQR
jgi:hypothetical protein